MIKKIEIQNYKGVKELTTLDFELNHLKSSQIERESTFIMKDGIKVMAVPTLIAKNASGKTSILEAVEFASSIKSLKELIDWVMKDIKDFENKLSKMLEKQNFILEESFKGRTGLTDAKSLMLSFIRRTAIGMNLGEVFDDHSSRKEISNEYLKQGMELLKKKIRLKLNATKKHIYNKYIEQVTDESKEIMIRIVTSNDEEKMIKIGKEIFFNKASKNFIELLDATDDILENNIFISNSFEELEQYLIYATGECNFDELEAIKMENEAMGKPVNFIRNRAKHISRRIQRTPFDSKLVDDRIIRQKINGDFDWHDWSGKDLLKEFVKGYGPNAVSSIISSIDHSVSHVEGDEKMNTWRIKDIHGIYRPLSNLSFGTFKTIFILNEMHKSWEMGRILMIDEIENGLNISLINLIVKIATNERFSKGGFQLIITTHNPLIFTQAVVNPLNAFINISGKFQKVKEIKGLIKRTEDMEKVFAPKNYFNEYFWLDVLEENDKNANTIGRDQIFELLDEIPDGVS